MAAKQITANTKINGLETNPSILAVGEGATAIADNVTFNRDGMAEGRAGFTYHATEHGSEIVSLIDYRDHLIVAEADGTLTRNDITSTTTTAFTGDFSAPSGSVPRGVDMRGNLYLTTAAGVRKLDGIDGAFRAAGMPPGLDLAASTTGTTGFMANNTAIHYRMVWKAKTDANGVIVRGAPSPLCKVANTTGNSVNVTLTFSVPSTIQAGDQWEVYRSVAVPVANTPNDDLYLVKSGEWTSGAEVSVTDTLLEDYLITPLYTNAEDGDGGILAANWFIPSAHEIETFKDYLYLGRTVTHWTKTLKLISATGSLVDNTSAITITDGTTTRTYTFSTAEDFASNKFKRFTGGTASQNIENTAKSLCRAINQDASGRWYAIYMSGPTDDPGIVDIHARQVDAAVFSMTADTTTTGDVFDPVVPTTGTSVAGTRDDKANRLFYSKPQQPEHIPLVNFFDIGRSDKAILGLRALKDSLFIIKEDGVFYLSGGNPNTTSLVTLDSTTFCVAPKSIAKLNNDLYFLSNQGVVRVNENGPAVISGPIERDITDLLRLDNINIAVGTGVERDRIYVLWVPTAEDDTVPQIAYVYNIFKQQWSRWTKPASAAGVVRSKLFIGSGWESAVLVQRDSRTRADHADEELAVTIVSASDEQAVISYSFPHAPLTAGYSVHQGDFVAKVRAILDQDGDTYTVEFDRRVDALEAGAATVCIPIPIHIRHHPNAAGLPGVAKTFLDFGFVLARNTVSQLTLDVVGNENGDTTEIAVARTPEAGWGELGWGVGFWGDGGTERSIPLRENVPNQHSTSEWLTIGIRHAVSQERFGLLYSYITYLVSTDVTSTSRSER